MVETQQQAAVVPAIETQFTGKERDAETGLDYFGARYFSGAQGRFTTADPFNPVLLKRKDLQEWISNPQRWNKYAYGLNNPLRYIDPDGQNACGTNDDKDCKVTVTLADRSKDKNGNYNDKYAGAKGNEKYNATATVTVNGKVVGTFLARTVSSDPSRFATVANGTYAGTLTMHSGNPAIRLQPTGHIPTVGPNPSRDDGASFATGILIHKAGLPTPSEPLGLTGFTRAGRAVSEGCQLICSTEFGAFLGATGIRPLDGSAPQRHFTVVLGTDENEQ